VTTCAVTFGGRRRLIQTTAGELEELRSWLTPNSTT